MKKGSPLKLVFCFLACATIFQFGYTLKENRAAAAVTNPSDVTSLFVTVDPQYPKANQQVTLTVGSYAIDLQSALIRWYVGGKLISSGAADTQITITSGAYGDTTDVKVQAVSSDGRVAEQDTPISPTDLSLLWQADTYTPPFYKGRRLYSNSSDITLVALPASGSYGASDLVYTWKNGADVIEGSGGLGKNTVTIPGTIIDTPKLITVDAASSDGTYKAENSIVLKPIPPEVIMYEDNPIYGIRFENAVGNNTSVSSDEYKLAAFPFFFSTTNRFLNNTTYDWQVGGNDTGVSAGQSSVIVKRQPSVTSATISVSAQSVGKILQSAETSANIGFTNTTNQ